MHRIYICTRFTCFANTVKLALFTGLEHSANTNTLAIAPGRIKEGWVQTPHKFSNSRKSFLSCFTKYWYSFASKNLLVMWGKWGK